MKEGLTIFLAIIGTIFLCGLCAMIYIISINAFYDVNSQSIGGALTGEAILFSTECQDTSVAGLRDIQLSNVVIKDKYNNTIPSEDYTINGGCIQANE